MWVSLLSELLSPLGQNHVAKSDLLLFARISWQKQYMCESTAAFQKIRHY
jgi:hypothetical protein